MSLIIRLSHSFKLSTLILLATFVGGVLVWAQPAVAEDLRTIKLTRFLASQESPLTPLAPEFVREADLYGLDYRLLPAISGVESTFGEEYLEGSYNVYGWGGGALYFNSWAEGIGKVSYGIRANYVNKGAQSVEQIGYIYNPANPVNWAAKVQYFMDNIEATPISFSDLPAPEGINLALTI